MRCSVHSARVDEARDVQRLNISLCAHVVALSHCKRRPAVATVRLVQAVRCLCSIILGRRHGYNRLSSLCPDSTSALSIVSSVVRLPLAGGRRSPRTPLIRAKISSTVVLCFVQRGGSSPPHSQGFSLSSGMGPRCPQQSFPEVQQTLHRRWLWSGCHTVHGTHSAWSTPHHELTHVNCHRHRTGTGLSVGPGQQG